MADLTYSVTAKNVQNGFALTGHPVKDKVLLYLKEVASDLNAATSNIAVVAGASSGGSDIAVAQSDLDYLKAQLLTRIPGISASSYAAIAS